jgi:small subunit ribosomal protein S8
MVKDKISDLINSLKNANKTGKDFLVFPCTNMVKSICDTLAKEGFIDSVEVKEKNAKKDLIIVLKYNDGEPAISGLKRVSKFSKRIYRGVKDIKSVKRGLGVAILTTPLGILTNKQAREQKVGGELLFEIW